MADTIGGHEASNGDRSNAVVLDDGRPSAGHRRRADTRSLCAIEQCDRRTWTAKADPRGLCHSHHQLLLRFGTPEPSWEDRLRALTDRSAGPDGCWMWTGGRAGPYGRFNNLLPHRIAYEAAHGEISAGLEIDHTCHNTLCVNPKHLRVVTTKQNKENRKGAHGRSGIRGVRFTRGKWQACVVHNRKYIYLGRFDTAEEAGEVARLKRLELFTHSDMDRRAV